MPDEIDAAFTEIERRLKQATIQGARDIAKEIGKRARTRVRKSRPTSDQDLLPGKIDPSQQITVREVIDGAHVTINPSYVRVSVANRQVVAAIDSAALLREGLLVKNKAGDKRHYQGYSTAPRLSDWAVDHNQTFRRSVWTGNPKLSRVLVVDPILVGQQASFETLIKIP